eukprot:gene8903-851_t
MDTTALENTSTTLKQMQIDVADLELTKQNLEQQVFEYEQIKFKFEKISASAKHKIILNIGGKRFMTSLETLTQKKGNFFSAMFSGQFNSHPDDEGEYFIDRDPTYFEIILNHLRYPEKHVDFTHFNARQLKDFQYEVDFYGIETLKSKIEILDIGIHLSAQQLSPTKFRITKTNLNGWNASIVFSACKKWKMTSVYCCNGIMAGVVDRNTVRINSENFKTSGFYVDSDYGYKQSKNGDYSGFAKGFRSENDFVIMEFDNGNLHCVVNGKSYGNAYQGIDNELLPSFDVLNANCVFDVEFIE